MRKEVAGALLVLALALVHPSGAGAQFVAGTLVDDDTGRGVDGARITLLRLDSIPQRYALTDSAGHFVLTIGELGEYMLKAERIGYATTVSQAFPVAIMDTTRVQFYVSREAVLLAPLSVQVRPVQGEDVFWKRKELGVGDFLDPLMVDSLRPRVHPGEIFKHVDKMRVRWSWGYRENNSTGPIPRVSSYLGHGCFHWVVDYTPVPDGWFESSGFTPSPGALSGGGGPPWTVSPLAELTPEDLVAVEIYRRITDVPEDIVSQIVADSYGTRQKLKQILGQSSRGPLACGVVIIWTKRGW